MMKGTIPFFALAASIVPSVLGHGFLGSIQIDGKTYTGPDPSESPPKDGGDSVIRQKMTVNPLKVDDQFLGCGNNAAKAKQVAEAKPGSTVVINWRGGSNQPWPHEIGPVLHYMASCNGKCADFDSKKAEWWKIDQVGQTPGKLTEWASGKFHQKQTLTIKLPDYLGTGEYLLRSEIISLHVANTKGGAEFYPGCAQISIKNGASSPPKPPTVKFPGAYKIDDPGIFVPTIFDGVKGYKFPGPDVFKGGSGSSQPGDSKTSSSSNSTSSDSDKSKPADSSNSTAPATSGGNSTELAAHKHTLVALASVPGSGDDKTKDEKKKGPKERKKKKKKKKKPCGKGKHHHHGHGHGKGRKGKDGEGSDKKDGGDGDKKEGGGGDKKKGDDDKKKRDFDSTDLRPRVISRIMHQYRRRS